MFYLTEVEDYVRVAPKLFGLDTLEAVEKQLNESYGDYFDKEIGKVVSVVDILNVEEGIIIPGDGATYYKSKFRLVAWKPELHELVYGIISEIANFGAFINLGNIQGLIHISQTMEDFVNYSDSGALQGKKSGRVLKEGDLCLARIVAVSYRTETPKMSLTMRQPGLGKLEWIKEEKAKKKKESKKATEKSEKEKGGKK